MSIRVNRVRTLDGGCDEWSEISVESGTDQPDFIVTEAMPVPGGALVRSVAGTYASADGGFVRFFGGVSMVFLPGVRVASRWRVDKVDDRADIWLETGLVSPQELCCKAAAADPFEWHEPGGDLDDRPSDDAVLQRLVAESGGAL